VEALTRYGENCLNRRGLDTLQRELSEQRRFLHVMGRTCWREEALTGHPENLPMLHHSTFVRKRPREYD
jgi:hypothetical protein